MKYRKKPVVIEAWPVAEILNFSERDWKCLPDCIKKSYEDGDMVFTPDGMHIKTLEGLHITTKGDMLIKGIKGEFYGCKPDIFEATYEQVLE